MNELAFSQKLELYKKARMQEPAWGAVLGTPWGKRVEYANLPFNREECGRMSSKYGDYILHSLSHNPEALEAFIERACEFPALIHQNRLLGHLARLLDPTRSTAENQFGLVLIRHAELGMKWNDQTIPLNMTGEERSTTYVWNYAPYIYIHLLEVLTPEEALKKVFKWATFREEDAGGLPIGCDPNRFALLSEDPADATHQLANLIAQEIAQEIVWR